MTYYVIKTHRGYFYEKRGYKVTHSCSIVNAKHYTSKKLAEKMAEKINGEVVSYTPFSN